MFKPKHIEITLKHLVDSTYIFIHIYIKIIKDKIPWIWEDMSPRRHGMGNDGQRKGGDNDIMVF